MFIPFCITVSPDDYYPNSQEIKTFPSGSVVGTTQCVTYNIVDDVNVEDDEHFTVNLLPDNPNDIVSGDAPATTVEIQNDDGK